MFSNQKVTDKNMSFIEIRFTTIGFQLNNNYFRSKFYLGFLKMKIVFTLFIALLFFASCVESEPKVNQKEQDAEMAKEKSVKEPLKDLKSKTFYEGIKKDGTNKSYKFRVDSIGGDGITMIGVNLFGEEEEISGLAMAANADSALVYKLGDKLVIELFDGVANFFKKDQQIKRESFIKKEYRFDMANIKITEKRKKKVSK